MLDEEGFELVGTGFRYETTNFVVKDFLAYGYNDISVVIKCTDSLKKARYLISYETGYRNNKGNPEISFKDLNSTNFEQIKNNYYWVDMNSENRDKIRLYKNLFFIAALVSLFLVVRKLF